MKAGFCNRLMQHLVVVVILAFISSISLADTNHVNESLPPTAKELQSSSNIAETNSEAIKNSSWKTDSLPVKPEPDQKASNEVEGWHWNTDLFITWSAAIFGILAVLFALFVLILAFKGWSEYSKIFEKINTDVETKLNAEVNKKAKEFFENSIQPQLDSMFSQKQAETTQQLNEAIANELNSAKKKLETEIKRLMKDEDISHQVVELAVAEVGRRLSPASPPSKPDEFEPTGEKKQ